MPYGLQFIKEIGLVIFRSETALRFVFIAAVIAHLIEASMAYQYAVTVKPKDTAFIAFWIAQTAVLGYPSLRIIKEQSIQKQAGKGKK